MTINDDNVTLYSLYAGCIVKRNANPQFKVTFDHEGKSNMPRWIAEHLIEEKPGAYWLSKTKRDIAKVVQDTSRIANYKKSLTKIKGVGEKTAEDIMQVYPTMSHLLEAVRLNQKLPFDEDVVKKLRSTYASANAGNKTGEQN